MFDSAITGAIVVLGYHTLGMVGLFFLARGLLREERGRRRVETEHAELLETYAGQQQEAA